MAPTPSASSGTRDRRDPTGEFATELDRRYGRSRSFRLRRRWIAVIVGVAFAAVFGAWVVWAGFDGTSASVDTDDAGYTILSDHQATVNSQVSVAPGTKVDCAVEVLNSGFDVVGWKIVHLPAQTQQTTVYKTSITTMNRGVTGLIDKCWLP
ncbi:DUF4307 domain-containing protein [Frondihabitans australicus]|uniref:Uncharacterized protein DUF4307 n=1 Tax=Frondihabitans australicus TaxID=386892 RepID=A0A495II72_9MICO|nr:DUF4307 domain-containing protein [Frondihabitans australicus]RKR75001.1 uncharacterized protein DUF4307 [Frondihabitans australicus]